MEIISNYSLYSFIVSWVISRYDTPKNKIRSKITGDDIVKFCYQINKLETFNKSSAFYFNYSKDTHHPEIDINNESFKQFPILF